jgi:hypothetical protein
MALPNGWPTKTPVVCPRSFVLTYRATIPLSTGSLTHLADLLRAERIRRGTRYRRLDPARQAPLVLVHLRNGDTPARLAGGFEVSPTGWRYIREAVDLSSSRERPGEAHRANQERPHRRRAHRSTHHRIRAGTLGTGTSDHDDGHGDARHADEGTRERDPRQVHRAGNRGLRTPDHAADHRREVQEHKACDQGEERTNAAPHLAARRGWSPPGRPG